MVWLLTMLYQIGQRRWENHQDPVLRQDHDRVQGQDPKEDVRWSDKNRKKNVRRPFEKIVSRPSRLTAHQITNGNHKTVRKLA